MTNFEKVQAFIQRANELRKQAGLPYVTFDAQLTMINEEYREVQEALQEDQTELVKELVDLLYVVYGALETLIVDADNVFELVHQNNMQKLGEGAKFRADGKLLKPDGFVKLTKDQVKDAYEGND
jgi:predicted HAD superfamily Cof-like phosphohydrolase